MDRRFRREWEKLVDQAPGQPRNLLRMRTQVLVAALAGADERDPALANAIATEVMNRLQRARYLGAMLVSATFALAILGLDYYYTRTLVVIESDGLRIVEVALILTALLSLLAYALWRGAFPRVHMALLRVTRRSY